jgi:hypothetical protein
MEDESTATLAPRGVSLYQEVEVEAEGKENTRKPNGGRLSASSNVRGGRGAFTQSSKGARLAGMVPRADPTADSFFKLVPKMTCKAVTPDAEVCSYGEV